MKVFGITGWKNAGKTELVVRLVRAFGERGVSVSTVKHTHHDMDVDRPGKDSFRHREAGAREVLLASPKRFALLREHRGEQEPGLDALMARLAPVQLVLVEGFKRSSIPKIEVHRTGGQLPLIAESDPFVLAVASDCGTLTLPGRTVLPLVNIGAIADFIVQAVELLPDVRPADRQ